MIQDNTSHNQYMAELNAYEFEEQKLMKKQKYMRNLRKLEIKVINKLEDEKTK